MKTLALAACASVCAFTLSASALGAGDISLPKQIRCKDISNSQDAVVHLLEAPIVTHAEEVTNRSQIVSEPNSGRFEPSVDDLNKVILFTGNSRFPDGRNEALQNFELAKVNNAYQWGVTLTSKSLVY